MRVLYINSVCGVGSTGRLVAEDARRRIRQGDTCLIGYGRAAAGCEDLDTLRIGTPLEIRLHGAVSRLADAHGFSSKCATKAFLRAADAFAPELVCLHNLHGYYLNLELLFAWLKQRRIPVEWTLHDCWAFTGHCTHFEAVHCEKWRTGCGACPQLREYPASLGYDGSACNWARKKAAFTGVENLTLVTPSQWLAALVHQSFLGCYPVKVVYNSIDEQVFSPSPSGFRQQHGLEAKKIALAAAGNWTPRKGLADIEKLPALLGDGWQVVAVGLTPQQCGALAPGVLGLPCTASAAQLAQLYTAADVFVNATYEDTYPTVNLEAQSCGTPVVTYDTGGSAETLRPGMGCAVPTGDVAALAEAARRVAMQR